MSVVFPEKYLQPLLINEGRYGKVFRAKQEALNRFVAIKELKEADNNKRKALINEAMIQADIKIPTVPHIYDAFEFNKKVYIVMEWVDGVVLSDYLTNNVDLKNNIALCRDLIASVAEVHKCGYAHRDIKPENIILSEKELPVLVDFGFAKQAVESTELTETLIKGTPDYMAPEILTTGTNTDLYRADVFSLAKVIDHLMYYKTFPTVIKNALSTDPLLRPGNAQEMLLQWDNESSGYEVEENYLWREWAKNAAIENLFLKKIEAVKEGIKNKKYNEAYWLSVECLNERPDSEEALINLQIIEENKKRALKQRKIIVNVTILLSLIIILLGSFIFWPLVKRNKNILVNNGMLSSESMIKKDKMTKQSNSKLVNKRNSHKYIWLNSKLEILNIPTDAKLYIDKKEIEYSNNTAQLTLNYGEYLIEVLKDSDLLWREQLFMSPFQKIRISIKSFDRKK